MKLIDLTGKKFGRLTVVEQHDRKGKHIRWTCKCDCGNIVHVMGQHLRSGRTKSCGCLQSTSVDFVVEVRVSRV